MGIAVAGWRKAAAWPATIQLGGEAREHRLAVRVVREAIIGPPLARLTLRERVHTLRAAAGTAVTIGEVQAVARVAKHGGLWIAHERPNLRPPGVERRYVKLDWERVASDHPGGRPLADQARFAQQSLMAIVDAVDLAVLPGILPPTRATGIGLVENRLVAKRWKVVEPPTSARKPEDEAPRRAGSCQPSIAR